MKSNFSRISIFILILTVITAFYYGYGLRNEVIKHFDQDEWTNQKNFQSYDDFPKEVINMLLLIEDQSFFNHSGIDIRQIVKVIKGYVFDDKKLRGASTISQQLIKNQLLTKDRTFSRKFKEVIMALLLESYFDKKYILELYLNNVYLGQKGNQLVIGFPDASIYYFNKPLKDLKLDQIAMLVALLKGPSYYHPEKYPDRLKKRQDLVLSIYNKYEKIVK
ncbi:transglycosylase domain-containing protein [Gammaproteobacteria bacterium]|jgi:membrane peptidoglycan carboxypeptidase|nr:transglycosylase domain-containing protein [Gammaproteobacteria bacterium]